MIRDIIFLTAGLIVLYFGAEYLVRGARNLALGMGIRPMIVGLTVVAFATSMPEFFVSFSSALKGTSSIAVGNIVGSNICNMGLIAGAAALVKPLSVENSVLRREMPIMLGVFLLFWGLAFDGAVSRLDGLLLFTGIILFTFYLIRAARQEMKAKSEEAEESEGLNDSKMKNLLFTAGGIIGLVIGANLMVTGAVSLASMLGISELVIGLSVVAFGTSLPELAASTVAAARGESDISLGNVIGSNISNVLLAIGLTAMISPIQVERDVYLLQIPLMVGFSVALMLFMSLKRDINRLEGALLLAGYIVYIVWNFL